MKNKTAIITGASRGIGRAIALKLAEKEANIVVNYRSSKEEAENLCDELKKFGVEVLLVKADVSNFDEAEFLIKEAKDKFGSIDILVNNAGITKDGLFMRMKEKDFDDVINVNLKGAYNCLRHVVPIMMKQKSGRIINISSVVGVLGNAGQVNYAASKAGVIGMTKSLAKEIGSRGITVNAVAPGFIDTDMTKKLSDKVKDTIKQNIALKKLGTTDNVADTVYFLASSMGEYITGQVISVDGGMVF
ncbi:3-oxoacyl-[acyl-carrier-protein] reductase [Clostridium sp. DL1XJH146]